MGRVLGRSEAAVLLHHEGGGKDPLIHPSIRKLQVFPDILSIDAFMYFRLKAQLPQAPFSSTY